VNFILFKVDVHRMGCFGTRKSFRIVTQQETIDLFFTWRFLRFSSHTNNYFTIGHKPAVLFLFDVSQIEFQRELSTKLSCVGLLKDLFFRGKFGSFLSLCRGRNHVKSTFWKWKKLAQAW
jgi:hypothetical protein